MQLLKCVFLVIVITPVVYTECILRNCTRIPSQCQYCEFENLDNLENLVFFVRPLFLTELKLVNCHLSHFGANTNDKVYRILKIQALWVENSVEFIDNDAFDFGDYNATYLISFTKNNISLIPNNAFQRLSNLDTVDFSQNRIVKIGENVFTGASSITHLNLSHNRIESFFIKQLINLEWVNLENNLITVLSEMPKALYGVHFGFNRLTKIAKGTFDNMKLLRGVGLQWNNITKIESGAFSETESLEYVDFSFNNITKLSNVIDGMSRLYYPPRGEKQPIYKKFEYKFPTLKLILKHNKISTLSNDNLVFYDAHVPIYLDLSQNSIGQFKTTYYMKTNVKTLDLSQNKLKYVPIKFFESYRPNGIEVLNLSTNAITELKVGNFLGLVSLQHLDLSHNLIETLNERIFLHTFHLLTLNLADNRIKKLNGYKLARMTHLKFINLEKNEFSCPDLINLIEQFENDRVEVMVDTNSKDDNITGIKCKNPQDLDIKTNEISTATIVIISTIILCGVAIIIILTYAIYYKMVRQPVANQEEILL